uniref:E3 ubiquitin-protein ligase listerin n=1 Tax=Bactrocera dorsalis TaxID=27457 RepID=A0A034VRR7_BACDO
MDIKRSTFKVKSNSKPSSSSRSAELLGTQTGIGFPTQSKKINRSNEIAHFSDCTTNKSLHNAIRKLNKKDPTTKKRALEELIHDINERSVEELVVILPLWTKIYLEFAYDPIHNIRELTQEVQKMLASKCKRMIAPYLKELVPVWICSQFDNYVPAANIARASFFNIFNAKTDRVKEVCLHCQSEILEYIFNNLSESSDSKKGTDIYAFGYNKVYGSLELLAFFIEQTNTADLSSKSHNILRSIIEFKSFWNCGRNGNKLTRRAWFKAIHNMILNTSLNAIISERKRDIIEICFAGIDESDRILSLHIWQCILLVQSTYADWYIHLDFSSSVEYRLWSLLQNNFFNNYESICPKMLPFCSALISIRINNFDWYIFMKLFLEKLKNVFCSETPKANGTDNLAILNSYFDCLKLVLNTMNSTELSFDEKQRNTLELLHKNIIDPTKWLLRANIINSCKTFFDSTLQMFADIQIESEDNEQIQAYLLKEFWNSIFDLVTSLITDTEHYPEGIIDIFQSLVKLNHEGLSNKLDLLLPNEEKDRNKNKLKGLASELVNHCLKRISGKECEFCLKHLLILMDLFSDTKFHINITNNFDVTKSLEIFIDLIPMANENLYVDIAKNIFKFLNYLDGDQQFDFINNRLISVSSRHMQILIIERLLLQPLKIGKRKDMLLSSPDVRTIISDITREALLEKSKEKITWLQTLFLQNDSDNFFIGSTSLDELLSIIFEPLERDDNYELVELCGQIISKVLPKIFSCGSVFIETKTKSFIKLFSFLIKSSANNSLKEETLSELSKCWESVLCDEHIVNEVTTLHCISNLRLMNTLTLSNISKSADLIIRFIFRSTAKYTTPQLRHTALNNLINMFTSTTDISALHEKLKNYTLFMEALNGIVSTKVEVHYECLELQAIIIILQRSLLNVYIIKRLQENDCKEMSIINRQLYHELLNCIVFTSAAESVLNIKPEECVALKIWIEELQDQIKFLIQNESILSEKLYEILLRNAIEADEISYCRSLHILIYHHRYLPFEESASIVFNEELFKHLIAKDALSAYINFLQYQTPRLNYRSITVSNIFDCAKSTDIWIKCAALRCLVINNFNCDELRISDRNVIKQLLESVRSINENFYIQNKVEIKELEYGAVIELIEYIRLLTEILKKIPLSLGAKDWDNIIIGLGSWVPSVHKSIKNIENPKMALFTINICKLFSTFLEFIKGEKERSSTALLKDMVDEWESLFSKDAICKIFESFFDLLHLQEKFTPEYFMVLFREIKRVIILSDFDVIYNFCKRSRTTSTENVFNILLKNFFNPNIFLKKTCHHILHELTHAYVVEDIKKVHTLNDDHGGKTQHYLKLFEGVLTSELNFLNKYISEFSFKISEIDEFEPIDVEMGFSYFLMWDCIIHTCVKSPLNIRNIYTSWLYENKFFEKFLLFVIRAMPVEVLKNHDSKFLSCEIFNRLSRKQLNDENLTLERYACHLYIEVLKKLPAVVRKWWSVSPSRQKAFVDKLTINYVSPLICEEELKAIGANKERHENMQVSVHYSTREVIATYFIDDVRTELTITLPSNYPLGPIKVDCGKSIGGRLSSRTDGMQLALFLMHQNGTIIDGLALWKNNLDKKFEGVEECYVCYTVINQDTYQLPKLTCKTCKKKFHGSCLYKWFTTSSKSTCPICRNVF